MKTKKIILLRHGQSLWNLENRFTGWTDIDLTDRGRSEAWSAGEKIAEAKLYPEYYFTSYQKRAINTLHIAAQAMDREWIKETKDWRLNERHYGALQGLNKDETAAKYGAEQVKIWRRSYDVRPPLLSRDDPRYPGNFERYKDVPESQLPVGESLKDTIARVRPCFDEIILPAIMSSETVLIVAHGNSLRGLAMMLLNLTPEEIVEFEIPTGVPLVFETDNELTVSKKYYL